MTRSAAATSAPEATSPSAAASSGASSRSGPGPGTCSRRSARTAAVAGDGSELVYTYDTRAERTGITGLLTGLAAAGIRFNDLHTEQSSLEDIFVGLVREERAQA